MAEGEDRTRLAEDVEVLGVGAEAVRIAIRRGVAEEHLAALGIVTGPRGVSA